MKVALSIIWRVLIIIPGILITWFGWHSIDTASGTPGAIIGGLIFYAGIGWIILAGLAIIIAWFVKRRIKAKESREPKVS